MSDKSNGAAQNGPQSGNRLLKILAPVGVLVVVAAGLAIILATQNPPPPPKAAPQEVAGSGAGSECATRFTSRGGPIELTESTGARVTQAAFAGKPALVYFGFAHCPDVCPHALDLMAATLTELGDQARNIQPVFITIDPQRDTTELLSAYVRTERFPPGLRALTGSESEIDKIAQRYGVFVSRDRSNGRYDVTHSSNIYVMDKAWTIRAMVPTNRATPAALARCVRAVVGEEIAS